MWEEGQLKETWQSNDSLVANYSHSLKQLRTATNLTERLKSSKQIARAWSGANLAQTIHVSFMAAQVAHQVLENAWTRV